MTACFSCHFTTLWLRPAQKSKFKLDKKVTYVFRLFDFSFFPFSFLCAAAIDFLLGLLAVKKLRKRHQGGQILPWSSQVQWHEILRFVFHSTFLSIFVLISGSIRPITLIWASLERSFPPAEVEYR